MEVGTHHHFASGPVGDMSLMDSVYANDRLCNAHLVEVDQYNDNSLQPADIVISQQADGSGYMSAQSNDASLLTDPGSINDPLSTMMSLNLQSSTSQSHRNGSQMTPTGTFRNPLSPSTIGSEIELARRLGVRFDSSNAAWVARWVDPHSEKKKSRWFSVAKYGELSARRLAIQACLQNLKASDFSNFRDLQDVLASFGGTFVNSNAQLPVCFLGISSDLMLLDNNFSVGGGNNLVSPFFHHPFGAPANYFAAAAVAAMASMPSNSFPSQLPSNSATSLPADQAANVMVCQGVPQDQAVIGVVSLDPSEPHFLDIHHVDDPLNLDNTNDQSLQLHSVLQNPGDNHLASSSSSSGNPNSGESSEPGGVKDCGEMREDRQPASADFDSSSQQPLALGGNEASAMAAQLAYAQQVSGRGPSCQQQPQLYGEAGGANSMHHNWAMNAPAMVFPSPQAMYSQQQQQQQSGSTAQTAESHMMYPNYMFPDPSRSHSNGPSQSGGPDLNMMSLAVAYGMFPPGYPGGNDQSNSTSMNGCGRSQSGGVNTFAMSGHLQQDYDNAAAALNTMQQGHDQQQMGLASSVDHHQQYFGRLDGMTSPSSGDSGQSNPPPSSSTRGGGSARYLHPSLGGVHHLHSTPEDQQPSTASGGGQQHPGFSAVSLSEIDLPSDIDDEDRSSNQDRQQPATHSGYFDASGKHVSGPDQQEEDLDDEYQPKKRKIDHTLGQSLATTACETTDLSQLSNSSSSDPSLESAEQILLQSAGKQSGDAAEALRHQLPRYHFGDDVGTAANGTPADPMMPPYMYAFLSANCGANGGQQPLAESAGSSAHNVTEQDVSSPSGASAPALAAHYAQFMNFFSAPTPNGGGASAASPQTGTSNFSLMPGPASLYSMPVVQQSATTPQHLQSQQQQHLDLALGGFYLSNPYQFAGLMPFNASSNDASYIQADDLYNDANNHPASVHYKRLGTPGVNGGLGSSGGSFGTHHGLSAKMTCERGLHYSKNYRGSQECWIAVWNTKGGRIMHEAFDVAIMGFEQAKSKAREARDAAHSNNLAVAENSRPSWKSHSNTGIPHVSLDSQQLRFRAHKFGRRLCRSFSFGRRRGSFASRESAFDAAVLWLIQTPTEDEIAAVNGVSSKIEESL